ncbi:MAG: hypothetical protein NTV05_12850 [Acidobacteria bacterium]|nr:hypothetical protein [Acidobacteriota bacterium]
MRTHPSTHRACRTAAHLVLSGVLAAGVACGRGDVVLLLTADADGTIRACASCSAGGGLGDISRRATAIADLRRASHSLLLVDAGNALIGVDSLGSSGRVIVAAYNAMGYDALNLSYRDFRLGKAQTLAALKNATFAVLSATLIDDASGRLLAKPFVVVSRGGRRIAIVGATEVPTGVADLPHIRSQLAGVRVRPLLEALAEWLPRAKSESDQIVLLYHGTAAGLDAIRQRHPGQFAAILVGGLRPDDLPARLMPPLVGTSEHGKQIAEITLAADGRAAVSQIDIGAAFAPDQGIQDLVRSFLPEPAGERKEARR